MRFFLKTRRTLYRKDELKRYTSLGFSFCETKHGLYSIRLDFPLFDLDELETLLAMLDGFEGVLIEGNVITLRD